MPEELDFYYCLEKFVYLNKKQECRFRATLYLKMWRFIDIEMRKAYAKLIKNFKFLYYV